MKKRMKLEKGLLCKKFTFLPYYTLYMACSTGENS